MEHMAQHTISRVPASLMPAQALLPKSQENHKSHEASLPSHGLYMPCNAFALFQPAYVKKEYHHVTK